MTEENAVYKYDKIEVTVSGSQPTKQVMTDAAQRLFKIAQQIKYEQKKQK